MRCGYCGIPLRLSVSSFFFSGLISKLTGTLTESHPFLPPQTQQQIAAGQCNEIFKYIETRNLNFFFFFFTVSKCVLVSRGQISGSK